MQVNYTEDQVVCLIKLPKRFQGWRGIAHGGVVSTLLDEVMAHAVLHFKGPSVTASMETRYKEPVPLETRLLVKGWIKEARGRMVKTMATVSLADSEDKCLAQATAKFLMTKDT
jgi:acyl-coenzyme A thioesterase PaaI-like protein